MNHLSASSRMVIKSNDKTTIECLTEAVVRATDDSVHYLRETHSNGVPRTNLQFALSRDVRESHWNHTSRLSSTASAWNKFHERRMCICATSNMKREENARHVEYSMNESHAHSPMVVDDDLPSATRELVARRANTREWKSSALRLVRRLQVVI